MNRAQRLSSLLAEPMYCFPVSLQTRRYTPLTDFNTACHVNGIEEMSAVSWAAEGCEALGIDPAPILAVRDWAGHSSVQETERYFHRVNRRAHARHVEGLDRYVRGDS